MLIEHCMKCGTSVTYTRSLSEMHCPGCGRCWVYDALRRRWVAR